MTLNSRQRRMESRKEKRERAADASAREQNDKTVTAEDLRKKMKDEGDDSAEALNTSQESMEKSMKKKREEGNEKKGAEEGPPGYTQPKYSDYLAIKAKEEEKTKKEGKEEEEKNFRLLGNLPEVSGKKMKSNTNNTGWKVRGNNGCHNARKKKERKKKKKKKRKDETSMQ